MGRPRQIWPPYSSAAGDATKDRKVNPTLRLTLESDPAVAGLGYHYTDAIDGLLVINNSPNHDKNIAISHNYFDTQNRVETSSKAPTQITP